MVFGDVDHGQGGIGSPSSSDGLKTEYFVVVAVDDDVEYLTAVLFFLRNIMMFEP
jgi:hypothetical protein